MRADLDYQPYFLPAFAALMGDESSSTTVEFNAVSEVRLKNTLEVALVLDNSGSMDFTGSGSGKKRLTLLKEAAKELVDSLSGQASQMKQVSKPVQFGVVPPTTGSFASTSLRMPRMFASTPSSAVSRPTASWKSDASLIP